MFSSFLGAKNNWVRLFVLALSSFTVPILIANIVFPFKYQKTIEVEEVEEVEEADVPASPVSVSSPPKHKKQYMDTRSHRMINGRTYSTEDESCDNAIVYLPENLELGSLSTLGLEQPYVIAMVGLPMYYSYLPIYHLYLSLYQYLSLGWPSCPRKILHSQNVNAVLKVDRVRKRSI